MEKCMLQIYGHNFKCLGNICNFQKASYKEDMQNILTLC